MNAPVWKWSVLIALPAMAVAAGVGLSQPGPEDFEVVRQRMEMAKPAVQKKQSDLLSERYDLRSRETIIWPNWDCIV